MRMSKKINSNRKLFIAKSKNGYGFTYFAKENIKKGECLLTGTGRIIDHQTAHLSIQIGLHEHYIPTKWTGRYLNHSCAPNTFIKSKEDGSPSWIASRLIKKGEEINYSYWMTEYRWGSAAVEKSIRCRCHTRQCNGIIQSFCQLSQRKKRMCKNEISRYLRRIY